ncbi:hypothetical protein [Bradyrhizobium sp.]|jgi:hypothetical protein|uniref:hypothetical protein n=1 Tax=Bradyrhizobium sp. TaxID=376 RepID=UPI003BB071ED
MKSTANWIQSGLAPSIEYIARAELFRRSAINMVDMTGAQLNWPKYFLLGHTVELALKAVTISFEERTGRMPVDPMPANHDLLGYYRAAVQAGMRQLPFDVEGILQGLAELHKDQYARYPKERRPMMTATYFDDTTDQILLAASDMVRSR